MVILAVLAVMIVSLWVFVAGRGVRGSEDDGDPGVERLRHLKLVVRSSRTPRGSQDAVVAELEPIGESDPTTGR